MDAPGDCSPSRKVVSKIITLLESVLTLIGEFLVSLRSMTQALDDYPLNNPARGAIVFRGT
jgi:hypothetical protein